VKRNLPGPVWVNPKLAEYGDPAGAIGSYAHPPARVIRMERKPDPVAPTPAHLCMIDNERSNITVTDRGGIHATCIVAGCGRAVYIAPGVIGTVPDPQGESEWERARRIGSKAAL
jgi:hypothetical protein